MRNDWPLGPARRPALIVAGLTLLAVTATFANGLPPFAQWAIAVAAVASGGFAVWRLLRPGIEGFGIDGDSVRVRSACGARRAGRLVGPPFVSPFYVGLRWREDGRTRPRSLGVFCEQMNATDFRRLCATLRQRGEA